ncbi:MAG: sodium:proton antiporter [Clostridia bacterium]|nr:sodium:proton antiporter [Clostridia bacterium]MBQ3231444.1 sodium:proton antiporter [Clostridia bacterium]MBQ4158582.1 sodium:proton antiporter [Clostridia bacterium]MBQ4619554.1 sodium:proton antiporter [Clostridia bacterium]MBQ9856758.1 sodium:proton antiporter [Clostridia bacterium]
MASAYDILFTSVLAIFGVFMFICLFRAVIGPTTADRVISINMIGGIVIMLIILLSLMMNEGFLVDMAVIYALLSFLAVVILGRIYIIINKRREKEEDRNA